MKKIIPIILGLTPFLFGGFLNWIMLTFSNLVPNLILVAVMFLLMWFLFARILSGCVGRWAVLLLNLPAFLVLILLGIQELYFGSYWLNFVGIWTQYFYLPLLNLGYALTTFFHRLTPAYCACFLIMAAVSALGCKFKMNKA